MNELHLISFMKTFLKIFLYLIIAFGLTHCTPDKKKVTYARIVRDVPVTKKVNYPDGKIKLRISYRKGTLSGIEYFNNSGKWDSIVDYKRGQRSSLISFKYNADGTSERDTYINNRLILKQKYDAAKKLVYVEPLDISHIGKTVIRFKSGYNFLKRGMTDTMEIDNKELPSKNRGYKFIGFTPRRLNGNSLTLFEIRAEHLHTRKHEVCILIYLHEANEHRQLLDSIAIPVH